MSGAAEDAVKDLSKDFIEVVRKMAEHGAAAVLFDQLSAMESVIYSRLELIERHLGIPDDEAGRAALGRAAELRKQRRRGRRVMAARTFTFTPYASNRDLVFGLAHAKLLSGCGSEPWVFGPLSAWMTAVEAELDRRGLLQEAERVHRKLLKAHHQVQDDGAAS